MTAKEYLNQTLRLEQKINSKIAQIESLNRIASKCTSVLSETAGCSAMGTSNMSNVIAKIVDLEKELNADIEKLITLKRDVAKVIKMVSDWKYRIVLEYRYLCFYTWGDIASELNYTTKWVRTLHEKALECVDELILTKRTPVSSV